MNTQTSHTNPIHTLTPFKKCSRHTDYAMGRTVGCSNPGWDRDFFLQNVQTGAGSTQPVQLVPGSFHGKRPWHDVHNSPPSRAAFKNVWGYTSNPHLCLQGAARDGFNFFNLKG